MTIYHGGTVECDCYGYAEFIDMQSVPVLFNDRPSFSEIVARARKELHCTFAPSDHIFMHVIVSITCTFLSSCFIVY